MTSNDMYSTATHHTACTAQACRMLAALLLACTAHTAASAQTRLWISGSAVPGGSQPLTRFETSTSGKYTFKFHGKLLPGTLCVQNTETRRPSTVYYAPTQVDANVVNHGIGYVQSRDSLEAAWTVLFEADNYRFTVNPAEKTLAGELFTQWYEAWITGGCVEDNQGSGSTAGQWQLTAGKAMEQSESDPNVWSWTGELKVYTANEEPNRLKINGQYGWSPKSLHPFKADQPLTSATQFWYCGPNDTKWTISQDGFYYITINVFEETMKAEYLGTTIPDGMHAAQETDAQVSICGRDIRVVGSSMLDCRLFTADGRHVATQSGTQVSLHMPFAGTFLLHVTDGTSAVTRKIITD